MGAEANILDVNGAMWEMHAPYGGHVGAVSTMWEPLCALWGPEHTIYRRQVAPYGSQMRLVGVV
jgi:hypothetical protein